MAPRVAELIALERSSGLYDLAYHAKFADKVAAIRTELHALVAEARRSGRPVAAYGTSVGSAALIHQFALEDKLDFLLDDTPFKELLEGPGYSLPVYTGEAVYAHRPALIIILAWRYARPIVANHARYIEEGGKFVVPLPEIQIIP